MPITHPDAALLVEEVQAEYVLRYGGRDETPIEPTYFDEPMGAFFVGYLDDVPVATGAWRRRTDVEVDGTRQTAEVKRMYVAPGARGLGLARAMLAHLEDTARAAGAEVMVLETGMRQPEAITLYRVRGLHADPRLRVLQGLPALAVLRAQPGRAHSSGHQSQGTSSS